MSGTDVLHNKRARMKWLGVFFSVALIVELVPSIMVQGIRFQSHLPKRFLSIKYTRESALHF